MVNAAINGHPVRALLDSAAEVTLLDRRFAQSLNIHGGTQTTGHGSGKDAFAATLIEGVDIEAAGVALRNQTVAVTDLGDVGRRLLHAPLPMILGRELFDAARLRIDIEGRRIGEVDRDSTPPGVALELTEEHGVTTLPVIVEGEEPVRATFDLGNGAQVLVSQAFAVRRGFFADGREVSHESGGGLGGAADRAVIVLKSLDLAGHRFENVEAAVDPQNTASDVNIGVSLLRSFILTTDFSRHRVWLLERKGRAAGKRIRRAA